jgi:twitching motility protein PilT
VKLLDSLLDAIVRLEGDALVMHVGEKPYVVTTSASMNAYRGPLAWGQVELSSRVLTLDAVSSMLAQILPPDQQQALVEFGAIEHEIQPPSGVAERFTVVAARGGEDVWVEVRRKPAEVAKAVEVEEETVEDVVEFAAPSAIEPAPAATLTEQPAAQAQPQEQAHHEKQEEQDAQAVQPAAHAEPEEPLETIVVAIPGQVSEEVPLSEVPDNAIQIIDEEPQGVPTEAEVDAMLAATASALLTSGLSAGPDGDSGVIPELAPIIIDDTTSDHLSDMTIHDEIVEMIDIDELPLTPLVTHAAPVPQEDAEPAFELSPPTAVALLEPEPEAAEVTYVAVGTPLFSDDAILAAAVEVEVVADAGQPAMALAGAPPETPTVDAPPIAVSEIIHAEPVPPIADVVRVTGFAPAGAAGGHLGMPRDLPQDMPDTLKPVPEPAAIERAPDVLTPPSAETSMDATPETRHEDAREPAGVVVPLARTPIRTEAISVPFTPAEDAALMHTLRAAAARGASTVYVVAQSKPMIRVDGEIGPLESEPVLTAADVERLVIELAPPRRRDALQAGPVEWLCDVPEIGRVRCLTFKDHRGPGVLFRMFPPRAISADQLGLTAEVQGLCQQSDGLVLVTGARASGKSTLLNAFVDLINRTRSDHVITIETQIGFVHESRRSFISQRETRGDGDLAASLTRAALREDPDVMMVEDLKSAEIVGAALEAAESGRLVLASVPAASTIAALERLIEVFPAERRPKARSALASALRGVVAQVLLRRIKGGQVPAREVLLNTPAVSTILLEGKTFQLPSALESGRRHGMVPLTDSLATHIREGTVQVDEAYRKALDRAALVAHLKREGIDTSFAERLA